MHTLTQVRGSCKRCATEICLCHVKRRKPTSTERHSNVPEGIEHVRRIGERQTSHRGQWAFKPSNGDIAGKRATPTERKALRRRYLQERSHDGEPDSFPK